MKNLNQSDPEYIQAMSDFMFGNWDEAETAFLALRRNYPNSSFIPLTLGSIYYSTGQLKKSVEWYRAALELEENWGLAWYKLGETYFRMGCLGKSLEAFTKVLDMKSEKHPLASYFIGLISFFLGRDSESDASFSNFHRIAPDSLIANFFLSQLKIKNNEFEDAIVLLQELLEGAEEFSEGYFLLGQAYYGVHDNMNAIKAFRRVLEINPGDTRAKSKLVLLTDSDW